MWRLRLVSCGVVILTLLLHGEKAHAETNSGRVEVTLYTGVALPFGAVDAQSGDNLDRTVSGAIPIGAQIGYYLGTAWLLAADGSYAPAYAAATLRDDCSADGLKCTTDLFRVGLLTQVHAATGGRLDPWMGLGSEFERLQVHAGADTLALSGWEFLRLDAGLDIRTDTAIKFGPFVSWSMGAYVAESATGERPQSLGYHELHEWFTVGVRAVIDVALTSLSH
jgi:hypothetical protein